MAVTLQLHTGLLNLTQIKFNVGETVENRLVFFFFFGLWASTQSLNIAFREVNDFLLLAPANVNS